MKNENNEEITQEEFEKKAKEIGKDISDYFVHVITHIKYDENNVPYADTELKEYMKKGQEKAKERAKYFENKEFSKIIEDFVYQQLNDVTEYAFNHAEELRKNNEPKEQNESSVNIIAEPSENICGFEYIDNVVKPYSGKYKYLVNKISNSLSKIPIDGKKYPIAEEKLNTQSEITTYVTFDFDEAAKITDLKEFSLTFSEWDKQVQEAVISLMCDNNKVITAQSIYRVLAHDQSETPTKKWLKDINESMRKFNSVKVTADFSETKSYYPKLNEIEKLCFGTRLMQYNTVFVKCKNGHEILAYEMLDEPILYKIAKAEKEKIATINVNELSFQETELSKTTDFMTLNNYLLKRIDVMKKSKLSKAIKFQTIYDVLGKTTDKAQRTTRDNTKKILDLLKQRNYISDFEFEKERAKVVRIKISL